MKAKIVNFRRSRRIVTGNQMVLSVESKASIEDAKELIGKSVSYDTGKTKIVGKIMATHGNKGAVRALFEKGMPGQAIGGVVDIQ